MASLSSIVEAIREPDNEEERSKAATDQVGETNEDIFGSLNAVICEELSQRLEAALEKGLQTLPSVGDKAPMLSTIRETYWRNIDLLEIYNRRNIFTLQSFPVTKRTAIAQLYRDTIDIQSLVASEDEENFTALSGSSVVESPNYPASVPTEEDLQHMQDETRQLTERKLLLEQELEELQNDVQTLDVATQLVDFANLVEVAPDVEPVLAGASQLQQIQRQADSIRTEMETRKRQRDNDGLDEIVVVVPNVVVAAAKTIDLNDRYERDRNALSNVANLKQKLMP